MPHKTSSTLASQIIWYNKHILVNKRSFYNTTLADKGINHVRQLFDTDGAMKLWSVLKSEFSSSTNSNFYWIQLNNAIPKAWKENLYKGDKNFHDLTFSGHHIIKKCQVYSLTKCNSKELYSLQVCLNDSKTKSQIYLEKLFKEIERKCIYLMPRLVTIDTNLHIFQYKILNNVLYLNKKLFEFKIISSPFCSFCNSENENPIHLFYSCNQTKSLWSKFQELLNSEILLQQNTP